MIKKNKTLIAGLAVALAITITAAAMSVDKFSDYNPPNILMIGWYDYFRDSIHSGPSSNNASTDWARWSAEYPYRAFFIGGKSNASAQQKHTAELFVVWSKKPSLNGFRFEHNTTRNSTGYIRAFVNRYYYETSGDFVITNINAGDMTSGTLDCTQLSFAPTYTTPGHSIDGETYFDFDFYYQCTDKHQTNTQLLSLSGLRNVMAPYAYILTCDDHGSSGGSQSGSSDDGSSGGGSSSGGSSSGGGGGGWHEDWPDKWPNGSGSSSSSNPYDPDKDDKKDYSSNPNKDNYPWEDDKNTPDLSSSFPSSSHPKGAEEDTGERGGTWTLPEWSAPDDLPFGDNDLNIPPMPDMNIPDAPDMPVTDFPELQYTPDNAGGWPPPFPY